MARYSPESRERVRDAVDMVELVSARTELRRSGVSSFSGLCPFHEERTPSFGIDPVKKVYHCFGCGAGGDVFRFVQETEGVDFPGALELLADRYGVELEREREDPAAAARRERRERLYALLERTAGFYARYLWESAEGEAARAYLGERGLEEPVLREFRVGYAPSAWDRVIVASRSAGFADEEALAAGLVQRSRQRASVYDRFRARLMFPLCDVRGRVLGFGARALRDNQQPKYLNSPEGELYHKGRALFGAHLARADAARERSVVVAEGYTDVLALHQAGMRNSVGLMGTAMTEEQVGELARLVGPEGVAHLALDADASGQEAMARAAGIAERRGLRFDVLAMPEDSDPAELVRSGGPEAIQSRLGAAVPFAQFQVERILAGADLDSTAGRDRAFERLRGVLGALEPSPRREDLVRLVAGRLALSVQLAGMLTVAPAAARGGGRGAAGPAGGGGPRVLDRREEAERTFLALCIALPEHGREALRRVDLEKHFSSPSLRRAAGHLRAHLTAPLEGAEDDAELASLLAELTLRAAREPVDAETLQVQQLQLEMARLEREIAAARAGSSLDVSALAAEREKVRKDLDVAVDRATERAGQA